MGRVSTIPAGVPFVDALAAGLLAEASDLEAGGDALALADMLVLLPNRRACRSLRDAFWKACAGSAMALPAIQPIGDLDPDELLIDAESELELPPAIGGLRRRLLLTRLLGPLGWTAHQAGRLADDLAGLLDELQTEGVPLSALEGLVPDHLAAHWQKSLRLMQIISQHWPGVLADEQALDPAARRHRVLSAIAGRWLAKAPDQRIIAAGSTGSVPATRELLRTILSLPGGEVVLPGLEVDLDDAEWQALGSQHPQYGLKQLLDALDCRRIDVGLWSGVDTMAAHRGEARRRLLSDIMRPSALEGGWEALGPITPEAFAGLSLMEHADPTIEATAIALRLRAALLQENRTAALITPDRTLARRVAVELGRFGIHIDDSAGVPLDRTAPGSFLLLTAHLVLDQVRPVALLSVLKHPLMRGGLDADVVRRRARTLDRLILRGPAIIGGFGLILDELNERRRDDDGDNDAAANLVELRDWLESLTGLARQFSDLMASDDAPLGELIEAHLRFTEALAMVDGSAEALWAKEAGEGAAALYRELLEAVDPADRLPPAAYPALLAELMVARPVRPKRPGHPRLFIWGQIEARLQQTDLTILAGLNEGTWPRAEEPGPWLNPSMRDSLGLPSLERRIGQAAHDFVQAAAGGEVVLSRAEKDLDGSPSVPAGWIVRLKALLKAKAAEPELIREAEDWQHWAATLDLPGDAVRPAKQPKPTPPISVRPRKLSVSDIGLWMSNPYGLYAKRILRLRPLEPLEADPGAADRGQIVHKALERFVREYPGALPEDARSRLSEIGSQAFSRFRQRPQVQAIWWPRFQRMADWIIAHEGAVRPGIEVILAEVEGELVIAAPGGDFRLIARADRLERLQDGSVAIVDYKTGEPPGKKDMQTGRAPQLPLEGAMLEGGGFAALGPAPLAGLQFWQLKGDERGGRVEHRAGELADGALDGLALLVGHYDQLKTAYPASYRPPTARRSDYDHLARLGEWPN